MRLAATSRRAIALFAFTILTLAGAAVADPYPPVWGGGAVHFSPAPWPADNLYVSATKSNNSIEDPRTQDPSHGGARPQNYVNISSSCTGLSPDQQLPSIAYYYDAGTQTIFYRWRVEQIANTYATGPAPGAFGNTDPWKAAQWTILFDTNGDGFRDFAAHLHGSSGAPATPIDRIVSVWSNTKSNSIDYEADPAIKVLFHNPTAFIDNGTQQILNFSPGGVPTVISPSPNWPNGSNETTWNYGTTMAKNISSPGVCEEYFIYYQIPLAMLDATAFGGPKVLPGTPVRMIFSTANSGTDPFQKDVNLEGSFTCGPYGSAPFGDVTSFGGGTVQQPTITSVTATSCPVALVTQVFDDVNIVNCTAVQTVDPSSVRFYYWFDANGDGVANDSGSSWTLAATGTASATTVGRFTATWNPSVLPNGKYLIAVRASDTQGNITWSHTTPGAVGANATNPAGTIIASVLNTCGVTPAVTKSADVTTPSVGQAVRFTLTLNNPAGSPSLSLTSIQDTLPPGFTFNTTPAVTTTPVTAFSSSPVNGSTGTLTWTPSAPVTIAAGGSFSISFTANAGTQLGTFVNKGRMVASSMTIPSNEVQLKVGAPQLTVRKAASVASQSPGGTVTWTITYSNDTAVDATNVVITDDLNAAAMSGLTYVPASASAGGVFAGGVITWNIGTVNAFSGPFSVTFQTTVNNPYLPTSRERINTAVIDSNETAPLSTTAKLAINLPSPNLIVQKSADKSLVDAAAASPANRVTYTITYANTGGANATGTTLTDALPTGTTFVSATGTPTTAPAVGANGTVIWTLGTLAPGASGSVTVTVTVTTGTANPFDNTASLDSNETTPVTDTYRVTRIEPACAVATTYYFRNTQLDVGNTGGAVTLPMPPLPNPSNPGAAVGGVQYVATTGTAPAGPLVVQPPLAGTAQQVFQAGAELMQFYSDPVAAGAFSFSGNITGTIYVDKSGAPPSIATLLVYDYDPATGGTTLIASGDATSGNITGNPTNSVTTFALTPAAGSVLVQGHRLLFSFRMRANHASQDNLVRIRWNDATSPSQVAYCLTPVRLIVDKTVDRVTVGQGGNLTYTVAYANGSPVALSGVTLADTLPAGTTFVSATGPTSSTPAVGAAGTVNWTIGALAASTGGSVTVTVKVDDPFTAANPIVNTATLDSNETAPTSDSASSTVIPTLLISKSVDDSSLVPGQSPVTYSITVSNPSSTPASGVRVTDAGPAPSVAWFTLQTAVNAGWTCTPAVPTGFPLDCTLNTPLAGNASATFTYTMQVGAAAAVPDGTTFLTNTAFVRDTINTTPRPSNPVTVAVTDNTPRLTLSKATSPVGTVAQGSTLTYTLTLVSNGTGAATDVELSDPIPANTSYADGAINVTGGGSAVYDPLRNRIVYTNASLASGTTVTVSFPVVVSTTVANATLLTNTATVTASNHRTLTATASNTVSGTVAPPVLTLTKTAITPVVLPLARLTAAAAGVNTVSVDTNTTSQITNGDTVSINNIVYTVTAVTSTTITLNAPVSAPAGTPIAPVSDPAVGLVPFPLTRLAANASAATTITVDRTSNLTIGRPVVINGTLTTITDIPSSTTATLSTPVSGTAGTRVEPTIEYVMNYANSGTVAATGVFIQDSLPTSPASLIFISATAPAGVVVTNPTASTVLFTFTSPLPGGEGGQVRILARLDGSAASPLPAGRYTNTALIDSNETAPVTASAVTQVGTLEPYKTTSTPNVAPGGIASYAITITNNSSVTATSLKVTDQLGPHFTYAATGTATGTPANPPAPAVDASNPSRPAWTWGTGTISLPPGGTITIPFTANVSANAPSDTFQNEVASSNPDVPSFSFDFLATPDEDVSVCGGTVAIGGTATFCGSSGGSTTLTAAVTGGGPTPFKYEWFRNGVSLGAQSSSNTLIVNLAGSYTVRARGNDGLGCALNSTATVVTDSSPATPSASNNGPICSGGTATLSTPTVVGATYSWTGPGGFTSNAQNPTTTVAGTYFVTVTVAGCSSAAGSTTLVVNPTPATPSASNNGPICAGGSATLSTPAVAGAIYSWTGPNGFTSSAQNPSATDAGTYFVTVTVGGCTSAAGSTTLVVNPVPPAPAASNDGPICSGGTANLSTPAVAGATYTWTGPNGFTSNAQNPTATDAGTYFVTITVNGCTSPAGSTTLVTNPTPATPTASNDGPICTGGTANLSTPAVAGATYAWTGPNGFTSNAQNPTATDAGTYFVTVTVNGCTSAAGSTTLVVNATPATPTASNDGPICTGGTANLSTPAVAGATYAWTGPNGFTSSAQNPTATDAGTYFVTVTVNGCTSAAGSTTLVVNATPATPTASNDGPICTGGTANLSTPAVAGATYAWTGPNGFTSSAQNPTATDAGTYFVTVTVNGCTSAAGSTTLVVNATPATPTASNDGPICTGGTANLSTPAVAGATYAWTGPNGFTSNAQNPTATDAGTYFVTVTVNGCTSAAGSTTLVVNATPATPTASNDGPICTGGTANLSTPAVAGATYAWTGPNGFTSSAQNPTATDAGTYFVTVTVNGCTSTAGSTTLVVNATPATPTASNDGPICTGGTANLSTPAVAGATYAWTGPNGFTSNAQNPTATDAGTYFVMVTVNGCTSVAGSTTLVVNATPATPTASNDGPICTGGTANLSTPAVAGATYAWTGPNGFTSNAQNPTATDAGTYFLTVTVNGCTSAAGSTTLVVNATPATPTASNDGPICTGGTANLSTPAVAGATYAWTGPNGFTSNAQNPTATDAGTYFVTVTVNGCPSPAGNTTLVVNAIPATPTASNDGPICTGGTANLSTPAVAGATYAWTGPNGFTSSAQNPAATDAGTYFVTVTVNGCTSAAGSTTLVVNATPATPTATNDGPICTGGTANLSTPAVAGATYAWTGPNGFTSNAQNPTATDAGTYFVTVTVNGCTSAAGSTTLVVNATPATPTASNDGPICTGGTANLSTPAIAGATYAWTGPNGFTSNAQTPTATDAGTYFVTITVNGCTSAAGSTALVVNATPATPTASNDGPICTGGTANLSTPAVAGATYAWTGPNGFTSNAQNPTATDAGTYFVTVTVNGCPSPAGSTTLVVNATPAIPTASNDGPICTGGTANLSTPAVAGATYAWTGPNGFTSNTQNPTATDAGTYFVTVTVNGCTSAAGSTTLVVNATPATPTASNDGPICTGGTANLSTPAVAGATYAWTGPNGFTSNAQNPAATDAGTYFVTITVNGCTSAAGSTTLIVNATPATPTASNDGPICTGGTANLSTPAVAGATYAWTGPNGFTSNTQNPTATDAGTYFVTVTVNGCTSAAGSTTLVVNATPATPTASNDGPICTGGTANLSTPAVAGATYAWTGPNGFTSNAQHPTATDAGTYFVTVTVNGCTSPAGSTTLVVNPIPTAPTASNDGPICTGGTANLSTPAVASATYAWTGPNGFTSNAQNPTATDAGTYFVTVTVNGCTSPAGNTTLVVNAIPATPTASNDGPVCAGGTANLSTPAVAGATYAWTGPNGFTSNAQNPTATDAGTYNVTITVNGCTSPAGSTTLVVNAIPSTPTASNDGPVCAGGTANLSTPAVAGATYAWTGPNGFTSNAQNPTATDAGTYFVTVTVNGCTSPAGSTTLVVNAIPATPTAGNDGPVCAGGTANLSTPAVAGATYAWTGPNGFTSNAQNPTATDAGTYFVTVTVNGCTSPAGNTTLVVNAIPATPTASNDGPICAGGTANLSTPAVAGATYVWTGPNGFTSNAQNPTATDAGTYFVTVTVNGCTSSAGNTTLIVNAIPATPTASNDGPICAGGTANLSTPAVAGATYAWTGPNGFTSNAQNPTATDAGTYNVTITVNGCTSPAGTTTLVVNAIPSTPTAGNDGPICAGGTANLSTPAVAGATYAWTGPNGFTSNAQNPTATDAGTYFVTVTVNGCTSPAVSTTLVVNAIPSTPTASNDGPICTGGTANLSTPAVAGATYAWTGPNGFTSNAQNPTATDAGTYNVTITVNGCTSPAGSTTLVVNAIPSTPTASNDGPVCAGGTVNLSTPAVAGATYAWTGPNGFTSNAQNPTATGAGTYNVTVTVNGCTSPAGSTTVVVNATPATPTATNDGPTCAGGTVNLSTPAVAGATYAWTGPNGFTSNAQNPAATDAGTYNVTVTVNGCTSPAGSTNVVINALPATPTATSSGPSCGPINLNTPAVAGATYAWTGPNGFTSSQQNPVVSAGGTYSVTVTVNGCTSAPGSTSVVVTPAESPVASNGGPFCANLPVTLTATSVAGATYQWSGPNGFSSTEQNPVIANGAAGTYSVTATVNGCVSVPSTTTVVIKAPPAAPVASNSGPYCPGQNVALSVSSTPGATFVWSGPNGFFSTEQNPVISSASADTAGVYSVVATVGGCAAPAATTIISMSGSCAPRPPVDLVLNKSVDVPNANEGDTITFTISVENLGAGTATGVVIRDVLPAGLTFDSATPSAGSYDSISGNWLLPTLNEDATATLQLRATVNAGQALQTLTNCASLQTSTPGDVNAANNEACAPVDVLPPDLEIVKTSDVSVPQVGDTVTYTITATNHGPGTAAFTDVRITDVLPAAVDLLSSNASQGTWSSTTGLWNAGSIASGATATLTITTRVNALGATMRARNCASLALSTPPDLLTANNTSCAPVDLAVTKTVDQPVVREGDRIRYRVTITNNGPTRATNVDVSSLQITGLTFVGATPSQGEYTGDSNGHWDIGVLEVGETVTLDIFMTVNVGTSGTTITNCANLAGSAPNDGDPSNDSGCATFTVIADQPLPPPLPDLSVTKTADATSLNEGSTFRYTIVVTNHGAGAAEDVGVIDRVPAGLQLNAVQASAGTYEPGSGIWSVGDLAEGASATLRITVTANSGTANTTITNCANVATPNANSLNDRACAVVQVVTPSAACGNNPPLLSIPLLQNVERGKRIEFRVAAVDPDGDPVSLSANGLPSNARFDAATGVLTFDPNDLCDVEDMLYTPTFAAIDGRGGITTAPVAITVVDRDALRRRAAAAPGDTIRTPILAVPQAPVRVNRPTVLTFKVTATAQENDCATAIVLTTPELGTFNTTTGLFTYQPNDVIARQIRLAGFRATDCRGRVAFANVPIHTGESTSIANALISTSRVRFAPALVGGERRAAVVSVTNRGNAPLRVSSLRLESGESFRVEGVAVLPVVIQPSHTVDLDVVFEPSRAGRASDRLLIESNDAVEPVAAIELEGNAVAAETIPVMNAETPATSATRAYAGTTSVLPLGPSVGVNAVCGNREPMLSVPPLVVAEIGKTLRFRVAAIDPDDDAVSIGVAQLPAGANIDPATGEFTFTPNDACEDEVDRVYDVTFIATDARGASVSVPVQITTVDTGSESAARRPLVSVPRESLRVTRGETLRFRVAARAQTNGCATTMSRLPNVGRYDATTGDYVVTPSVDSPVGSLLLPFEGRDCDGRTTLATVRVEVVDGAVRAGGRARVPVESLEFTSTPSRSSNGYALVTIANDGDQPLRISRVSLASGAAFRIDGTAGLPVMVRPGQVLPVRIVFEPGAATGELADTLVIETSDAVTPQTRVQLKGVGR